MSVQSIRFLAPLLVCLWAHCWTSAPAYSQSTDKDTVAIISNARQSIVSIEAKVPISNKMGAFGKLLDKKIQASELKREKWYLSMGSGVVWDKQGHIVTTRSTVENASSITVKFANGQSNQATLIGVDELTNLAVLRILSDSEKQMIPTQKRNTKLPEGSWLVLMGYGYGGIPTVSPGMAGVPPEDFDSGRHWFQFTAPLRPGNSGGALIDSNGNLAGIVLGREEDIGFNAVVKMLTSRSKTPQAPATAEYSNFGVAVPLTQAIPVVRQIIREGSVVRGWIGVSVRQLTDLNTGDSELIVVRVIPESPADHAGLEVGDRIHCLNTHEISSPLHLGRIIRDLHPGQKVSIDFDRNGKRLRSEILIIERPKTRDLPDNSEPEADQYPPNLKILEEISATQ